MLKMILLVDEPIDISTPCHGQEGSPTHPPPTLIPVLVTGIQRAQVLGRRRLTSP